MIVHSFGQVWCRGLETGNGVVYCFVPYLKEGIGRIAEIFGMQNVHRLYGPSREHDAEPRRWPRLGEPRARLPAAQRRSKTRRSIWLISQNASFIRLLHLPQPLGYNGRNTAACIFYNCHFIAQRALENPHPPPHRIASLRSIR